jgi:hypothetical protein
MKIVLKESQLEVLIEKYKIGEDERLKLFENEDYLLVAPLTRTASCKYGAGTKWCVTEKNNDSFERHYGVGTLAFLMIKNPEIQEKLNNTKFAFYSNKPNANQDVNDINRIFVYDDKNNFIPTQSFLNFSINTGTAPEIENFLYEFINYAKNKFRADNYEMIKLGLQNPF